MTMWPLTPSNLEKIQIRQWAIEQVLKQKEIMLMPEVVIKTAQAIYDWVMAEDKAEEKQVDADNL